MRPQRQVSEEVFFDMTPEDMAATGAKIFGMFMGGDQIPAEHFLLAATNAKLRIQEHMLKEILPARPLLAQEIFQWVGGKDFLSAHPLKDRVGWELVAGFWISVLTTEKGSFNLADAETLAVAWAKDQLTKREPKPTLASQPAAPAETFGQLVEATMKNQNVDHDPLAEKAALQKWATQYRELQLEKAKDKAEANGTNGHAKATDFGLPTSYVSDKPRQASIKGVIAVKIADYERKIAALRRLMETIPPEADAALGDIMADLAGVNTNGEKS